MSDVSVIGTGSMGTALVEALQASGADVTVWNRTKAKAEALSGPRVRLAESVKEALTSSPLTIMSVLDHDVARTLVEGAEQDLRGRIVASTSFVTADQAKELGTVVSAAGGAYLDLEIAASPRQVRARAGVFLVSGERTAFEAQRERLKRIGRVTYVNAAPASAYLCGMAVQLGFLPMAVGLLQGARIAESRDVPPDVFRKGVLDLYPFHIEQLLDRIVAPRGLSGPEVEASVDVMAAWAAEYGAVLREMGIDPGMYDALHRLFTAASEAGHGEADWTCIAEHVATRSWSGGRRELGPGIRQSPAESTAVSLMPAPRPTHENRSVRSV
jgi:3-hydroxyisobutyrate dehydrogenase-like beta-hydroxyacid dehydrogenase